MTRRPRPKLPLDPTERYIAKRARLSSARQRALQWVEEDIAEDPDNVRWRRQTTEGMTLDFQGAADGLMVVFDRTPDSITLVDLIDLVSS